MKSSNLLKFVGAGMLTFTVATAHLSSPVFAQTSPQLAQVTTDDNEVVEDNDFDWGWLGLLGLIGLAGLAGRNRRDTPSTYQDPNAPGSTYR